MPLHFEAVDLSKQQQYLTTLSKCPVMTSDYSFANLWGWADEYGLLWAWAKDLVWIKQTRPEVLYWAPVGPWETVNWNACFDEYISGQTTFTRIPEKLAQYWESSLSGRLDIKEDRGHWDYLYSVSELVELKGNRFHKKKNLLNQFKRNYNYTYLPLEGELIDKACAMQTDWCVWRDCESSDTLSAENRSISRTIRVWEKLKGLFGGALLVDSEMVAYTVAERLTNDTLVIHFEKGNADCKGVYQAINQMFLAHLKNDFQIVNREQDLGDEGLRKAKLSYQPVDFLRKFQISVS